MNKSKIDLLSQMISYHERLTYLADEFKTIISLIAANRVHQANELGIRLYRDEFINHFTFEEKVVFPAILACSDKRIWTRKISEYLSVHQELLMSGSTLLMSLMAHQDSISKEQAEKIVSELGRLNMQILSHADDENRHIVPLLRDNPTLRFISARNKTEFQFREKQSTKKQGSSRKTTDSR